MSKLVVNVRNSCPVYWGGEVFHEDADVKVEVAVTENHFVSVVKDHWVNVVVTVIKNGKPVKKYFARLSIFYDVMKNGKEIPLDCEPF